jgi:hypothetical protein
MKKTILILISILLLCGCATTSAKKFHVETAVLVKVRLVSDRSQYELDVAKYSFGPKVIGAYATCDNATGVWNIWVTGTMFENRQIMVDSERSIWHEVVECLSATDARIANPHHH